MNAVKLWFRVGLFLSVTGTYAAWAMADTANATGLATKAGLWTLVAVLNGFFAIGNACLLLMQDDDK